MLDTPKSARLERINSLVREFVKSRPQSSPISLDEDLETLGLTSLDLVNLMLMLAVEAEFDLTIPGSRLLPANFRSIERIDVLVSELTH